MWNETHSKEQGSPFLCFGGHDFWGTCFPTFDDLEIN